MPHFPTKRHHVNEDLFEWRVPKVGKFDDNNRVDETRPGLREQGFIRTECQASDSVWSMSIVNHTSNDNRCGNAQWESHDTDASNQHLTCFQFSVGSHAHINSLHEQGDCAMQLQPSMTVSQTGVPHTGLHFLPQQGGIQAPVYLLSNQPLASPHFAAETHSQGICNPIEDKFPVNSYPVSSVNDRPCPECAAGKSGHIRHIGRWRLMDS